MKPKHPIPVLLAAILLGPLAWAGDQPETPRLDSEQTVRIRALLRETKTAGARLEAQIAAQQSELARVYAEYALDEEAARKLQGEIVDLQRRLLENQHRMQVELRAIVGKESFEILRRRLEKAPAPATAAGAGSARAAAPEAPPSGDPSAGSRSGRPAEIIRDAWGTPHVFADSETNGFFALGYACAEDRVLQMDLLRRRAAGRLAEVFGPDWVDSDRESRIAGYSGHALTAWERLPGRWQEALRAYAAGVNAFMGADPRSIARRFKPLGILPEPWTPADCLLAARGILALGSPFDEGAIEDYRRFRDLAEREGEAEAARRSGMTIDDEAAIVPESEMARDAATYARLKGLPRTSGFDLRGAPGEGRKMSHAWAVSGRRSTTGKPILESDPQLPLCSPPFFYEFHLAAGRIDARGLGIPGCPGLFIGWNRRIAWGASALGVDSVVTFLEILSPDRKGYIFQGETVPFERRLERIDVKGGAAVIQEVLTSRHGTVFNSLARAPRAGEAYLAYDAQTVDGGTSVRAMLEALGAGSWDEFRLAMEHYYYPGIHVVYADVDGHVGYQTVVHRPLTTRSSRRALEGWTGKDEVLGRIPFDDLPRMLDPEAGFVSHANNLPVGSWYPYDLGIGTGGTGDTTRSSRLRQLLAGDRKFSVEDFERLIHRDDVNAAVAALLPIARKVVEEDRIEDRGVRRLLASLDGWDFHAASTDRYPAARSLENTLTPYRGSGLQDIYGAGGGGVSRLAREVGRRFAEGGSTPEDPRVRAYLVRWLQSAASGGRGRGAPAGGEPEDGGSGGRTIAIPYQRTIPHDLPPVDPSLDIVSPPLACLDGGTIWSQPGNLYTQIVDLANIDGSRSMIAPGNSEDADSPFRTSGIDLWVRGETHPSPLSREKVEAQAASRTRVAVNAYAGAIGPRERTVMAAEPADRFVPAIPEVRAAEEPRPLPGRKPDDPRLEGAFRYLLRTERTPAEIDAKIEEVKALVAGQAALEGELREALRLGIHLMEESQAGRLKVNYGTPHCLARMREVLSGITARTGAGGNDAGRAEALAAIPTGGDGLVGRWPLRGDCRDLSGLDNHGRARGDGAARGSFDGRRDSVEVPAGPSLRFGVEDFSLCAWVWTAPDIDDVLGDVISQFDPIRRRGFHLSLGSSAGGYNSHGDDRHIFFGIDDGRPAEWEDCGRPSATSNYISNSITVFDGSLYAAITDAAQEGDWCHVFRYKGGASWEDCGRVGALKARGVGPMAVHKGALYGATWNYDWTRVGIERRGEPPYEADFCRVYRYAGGTSWEDCGQPGRCRRLFALASYKGRLYVTAEDGRCYVHAGGRIWEECGRFPNYAHPFGVHDGRLFAGVLNPAGVWAYDGAAWTPLGNPQGAEERCNQVHALEVFGGRLLATTWPEGHVVRLDPGDTWVDAGRLGDAIEINALSAYNGKLYGGTIPRAEVYRYDGGTSWTSIRRFLDPAGYEFKDPAEWARVTSLTVYAGRLFAGMGSCTSSHLDAPADFRGRIYALEVGKGVSFDRDLGPGWKHLAAVKRGGRLELWVDGGKASESTPFDPSAFDLTTDAPLRIGLGETDRFCGKIRQVRAYSRALDEGEIRKLAAEKAPDGDP